MVKKAPKKSKRKPSAPAASKKGAKGEKEELSLLRRMLQIRRFEEKCAQAFMQAKIKGFCHLCIGQEAVVVGTISVLKPTDAVITAYRDHGHALARGMTPRECMPELPRKTIGTENSPPDM